MPKKKGDQKPQSTSGQSTFGIFKQAIGNAPRKPNDGITINQLAEETGSDRTSIKKWLKADGIQPLHRERLGKHDSDIYPRDRSLECVYAHQSRNAPETTKHTHDPVTGLTWFQAKTREEALAKRRENENASALADGTLIKLSDVEKLIGIVINRLELIPSKMQSEHNLPSPATKRLQSLLDEARSEMAKDLSKRS